MCVVSMVGDQFNKDWDEIFPGWPRPGDIKPYSPPISPTKKESPYEALKKYMKNADEETIIKRVEEIKKQLEALVSMLKAAKEYDKLTGQPDCEIEPKVAMIKSICTLFGVDLSDVFDKDELPSDPEPEKDDDWKYIS